MLLYDLRENEKTTRNNELKQNRLQDRRTQNNPLARTKNERVKIKRAAERKERGAKNTAGKRNDAKDTGGCLLVASDDRTRWKLGNCRKTFEKSKNINHFFSFHMFLAGAQGAKQPTAHF